MMPEMDQQLDNHLQSFFVSHNKDSQSVSAVVSFHYFSKSERTIACFQLAQFFIVRLCVKAQNRTGDVRYLLSSVSPEAHSVGEVGLQLGAITTALNSVQDLQTAEEDPTVQGPLENRHLLNNSSNQSCAQMQILHVYNKSTTYTDLPVYYVHLSCNCYTTASHPVMERGHQWTTAGQM